MAGPDKRWRLDVFLAEKKYARTRSHARDLIKRGAVFVDGAEATRPSMQVGVDAAISLKEGAADYVSRGGLKLEAALDVFGFSPEGLNAVDIGASTGGFSQILLERDVGHVTAVDVGRGQIDLTIASDDRVTSLEGFDARDLTTDHIDGKLDAIVADVSFVSVTKVLPAALALAGNGCWLVALIKPQFEVGRELVGKGGVVRDEVSRLLATENVKRWINDQPGWSVVGVVKSPIRGNRGNEEYLVGAVFDVDQELFSN